MNKLLNTIYTFKGLTLQGGRIIMLLLLPLVAVGLWRIYDSVRVHEIYAVDPLVVTYDGGGNPPSPMFVFNNIAPGFTAEKTFNVKNDSPDAESVTMDGVKTEEVKVLAEVMDLEITELPSTIIYSGKLQAFFDLQPKDLGVFTPGQDKNFKVKVTFPTTADNEYQGSSVTFDIVWATKAPPIILPAECSALEGIITKQIDGTEGHDKIRGTMASELILAKGGNDKVDANGGNDCVVLGDGNDRVTVNSGNDIILGGAGNDNIDSGSENDTVYGGPGNDNIDLGTGNDKAFGGEGNDTIDGSAGNDEINAGDGIDNVKGGSGTDKCTEAENVKTCEL